jgi:orotate phosphoribosyltransferase
MYISVQTVVDSCDYELTYFLKVLSRNGIKNHHCLTLDDLLKLYYNEKVISKKAFSLKLYLEELLKDVLLERNKLQKVTA